MSYHLFGDSHIGKINNKNITKYPFPACSAMGLNNPNSISGYRKKFLELYHKVPSQDIVMLKFGQVDTEFVYYIKMTKQPISFNQFAIDSVNKYFRFIKNNLNIKNLIIISIFPPFLNDKHIQKGITGLHFMNPKFKKNLIDKLNLLDIPKIDKRVSFNKIYNILLKTKCDELNIPFINLESILLNNENIPLYVNNLKQHHIKNMEGIKKINKIISEFIKKNTLK